MYYTPRAIRDFSLFFLAVGLLALLTACASDPGPVEVRRWWPNSGVWHPLPDGVAPWPR